MKILKYLAIALLAINTTTSCDKFLDINPSGEVVNNEIFNTPEGFEDAIYGVYASLGTFELYAANLNYKVSDVLAQYVNPSWGSSIYRHLCTYDYKHLEIREKIDDIWLNMYANISNVNNILDNLKLKEPATMRYYALYKGESLALRAFMHFELTRYYCDNILKKPNTMGIPYRESYTSNVNKFEPLSVTYEKIIRDLKEAEELLKGSEKYHTDPGENPSGFVKDRVIHLNIYAVKALLARVYWTMNDLETAAKYAKEVIDSKQFSLVEPIGVEHVATGVLSPKEAIFGVYSKDKFKYYTQQDLYYSGGDSYSVKKEYEDWYNEDRDGFDYRFDKWFKTLSDFGAEGLRCTKIIDWFDIKQSVRPEAAIQGINIIRIPEMYYIVTEYYMNLEDFTQAHSYLDKVLVSRGLVPYVARPSYKINIRTLNIERRKEYVCEGQYFHVLKKYDMDSYDSLSDKVFRAADGIYVFPIPQEELDSNPIN